MFSASFPPDFPMKWKKKKLSQVRTESILVPSAVAHPLILLVSSAPSKKVLCTIQLLSDSQPLEAHSRVRPHGAAGPNRLAMHHDVVSSSQH